MSGEMIERISNVINRSSHCDQRLESCQSVDACRCRLLARSIFEAMREPTSEIAAQSWCEGFAQDLWRDMIDAILARTPA